MINLLLIFIFVMVSMYVSSYHIDHFEVSSSSGKLIKPTCNRNTIYNTILKLENDIGEINLLLKQKERAYSKYGAMYKWYKQKSMGESERNEKTKRAVENIADQMAKEAEQRIDDNRAAIEQQANERQKREIAKLEMKYN